MAAQLRYRTLVHNIGRVYASSAEGRTDLLQSGLDEIVATQRPATAAEWNTVGTDSERLLKVWVAKEGGAAAHEAAAQIVDLLYELAADPVGLSHAGSSTAEKPPVTAPALVVTDSATAADRIAHVLPFFAPAADISSIPGGDKSIHSIESDDDDDEDAEEADGDDANEVEEEAAADEEVEESEEEVDAEVEAAEAEEEVEEEGAAIIEKAEEVLEPKEEEQEEEEEAEEEGMEVEQIFIRGRAYWHETNTHKLYELVGEDDVGDEIGELVGGKPRFYAK